MQSVNSGYVGWSMSKRAAQAYDEGQKPKSKWTKGAMLNAIRAFCKSTEKTDDPIPYDRSIEKLGKREIFERFFEYKSWHHTSKHFNVTDFYGLDEEAVRSAFLDPKTFRARRVMAELRRLDPAGKYERECASGAEAELKRWKTRKGRIISPIEFIARYGRANDAELSTHGVDGGRNGLTVRFDGCGVGFDFYGIRGVDTFGMRPSVDLDGLTGLREDPDLSDEDIPNRIDAVRGYLHEAFELNAKCCDVVYGMRNAVLKWRGKYDNPTIYQVAQRYPWMVADVWESAKGNVCIRVEIPGECLSDCFDGHWEGTLDASKHARPSFLGLGKLDRCACWMIGKQMAHVESIDRRVRYALPRSPKTPSDVARVARDKAMWAEAMSKLAKDCSRASTRRL